MNARSALICIGILCIEACQGTGANKSVGPVKSPSERPTPQSVSASGGLQFITFAGSKKGVRDGIGGDAEFDGPIGIDVGLTGRVYITENGSDRIRSISKGGLVKTIAGSQRGWQDGDLATAKFSRPSGISVMPDETIIVADTGNNRIRKISSDGRVTTLAGNGTLGSGDGAQDVASFNSPSAVAVTALGEVLVADTGNHRIRKIDTMGIVTTLTGGVAGYSDGPITQARFNAPVDIAVDRYGRAYIADLNNSAIRLIDIESGTVSTVAGTGTQGFEDGPPDKSQFRMPSGISLTPSGRLLIADSGNSAVREVEIGVNTSTIAKLGDASIGDVAIDSSDTIYLTSERSHRILLARRTGQ